MEKIDSVNLNGYSITWLVGKVIGERRKARGEDYLFLMVSNPCPKTPLTLA